MFRPVPRSTRLALTTLLLALATVAAPSSAGAAARLETIEVPSAKGYVQLDKVILNKGARGLQANVLLPEGYDEDPGRRWPVLYLLSGVGDTMASWNDPAKGDIQKTAKGLPAIIVMPESGRGYFTDWWRGGQRDNPQWERYHLEELIPTVESRYRIAPGRSNHAIGGISMGAYGAVLYAGQFPGYFGTSLSLSGLLDSQSPEVTNVVPLDIGSPYRKIWGPVYSPYARAHNPLKMIGNLFDTRLYMSTGNGTPLWDLKNTPVGLTAGSVTEYAVWRQSLKFSARARVEGVQVEYSGHKGVHDWAYWRVELPRAIRWGLFGAPKVTDPSTHHRWTYKTIAPRGNAWGIGYAFAAKPMELATFTRDGQRLVVRGAGTMTISPGARESDASGAGTKPECTFTAKLPIDRILPAGC